MRHHTEVGTLCSPLADSHQDLHCFLVFVNYQPFACLLTLSLLCQHWRAWLPTCFMHVADVLSVLQMCHCDLIAALCASVLCTGSGHVQALALSIF